MTHHHLFPLGATGQVPSWGGRLTTIAVMSITAFIITTVIVITASVALARSTRRRLDRTPDFWDAASRDCEVEWFVMQHID